jgi:subtilisin family serine protease
MPKARPHGRAPRHLNQVERLEGRQLLSGEPWSASARLIAQDQAAVNYPTITGAGESVVIIDSGVDYKHPALGGGLGSGFKVEAGWDFVTNDADPFPDTFAHGTGTAGGVAANGYLVDGTYNRGVAPGVNLIALRENGSSQVRAALQWVLDNRAKYNIVAVSMVDYGGQPNTFKDVFKKVADAGIFVAHPSGNGGPSVGMAAAINPADFAIGSVNAAGQMSSFTQRGPELDLLAR